MAQTISPSQIKTLLTCGDSTHALAVRLNVNPPTFYCQTISTSGGTVTNIATSSPILGGPITTTGTISCQTADTSHNGCLTSTDWNTFNGKGSGTVTSSGSPVSGNIPKFTSATNIAPASATDIAALWASCSGTQYLGFDGNCHTAGSGTVTSTGTLTANQIIIGNGTVDIKALGSLGTTTTVLHGNASGAPSFGAVANADLTNSSTTVNGTTCTLGSSCTVSSGGGGTTTTPYATPVLASPDIPHQGMWFWYDAGSITQTDATSYSTPADGTVIVTWADRSGNNWTALTAPAGTATTFRSNVINGQPVVRIASPGANWKIFAIGSNNPLQWRSAITVFAVLKNTSGGSGGIVAPGQNNGFFYATGGTKEQRVDQMAVAALGTGTAAVDTANFHQINVHCNQGSNPSFRIDRATDTTISGASCGGILTATDQTYMFAIMSNPSPGADKFIGDMAEIICYGRELSSTEITAVETYLNAKYGL